VTSGVLLAACRLAPDHLDSSAARELIRAHAADRLLEHTADIDRAARIEELERENRELRGLLVDVSRAAIHACGAVS
jgi:hypothetical protein